MSKDFIRNSREELVRLKFHILIDSVLFLIGTGYKFLLKEKRFSRLY